MPRLDGTWLGHQRVVCAFCTYERVGTRALEYVEQHEREEHAPTVRRSPILSPDGQPIEVISAPVPKPQSVSPGEQFVNQAVEAVLAAATKAS